MRTTWIRIGITTGAIWLFYGHEAVLTCWLFMIMCTPFVLLTALILSIYKKNRRRQING